MRYLIVPLLVASLTCATAQADNGRRGQDKGGDGDQYHPKVREAVENSQKK
jgi:hypothetical protein